MARPQGSQKALGGRARSMQACWRQTNTRGCTGSTDSSVGANGLAMAKHLAHTERAVQDCPANRIQIREMWNAVTGRGGVCSASLRHKEGSGVWGVSGMDYFSGS